MEIRYMNSPEQALQQINRIILGKPQQIRLALSCMLAGGHLLLEDIPGVGKTTLAHVLAATLGLSFQRVQFTADLTRTEIKVAEVAESSAWGAAMSGLLGLGICKSLTELTALPQAQNLFHPRMKEAEVKRFHQGWRQAVRRVL